jgi:glycosyltransferase involved in cell wall biosynthesis
MDLVSVVIPTYNRFKYVLNLIASVKSQTYPNIQIIVVNDCSNEKEYYEHDWDGVTIIHLKENSKSIFGYACAGYVRNKGIDKARGKYVAFCDDDDIWFPTKIELQVRRMKETGCKMSSTDGLMGRGVYDSTKLYPRYNAEYYYSCLQNIYKEKGSSLLDSGFPSIWDINFLRIHNCIITSSVIVETDILHKINKMAHVRNGQEDYDCWLRALEHTKCAYIPDICFYYDSGHGYGINNE